MSYKIVDQIKKLRGMPRKYKTVLEAYASFANKDGTNIRPSKEKVADRAGVNVRTVQRITKELATFGVLAKTGTHNYGHGHWTFIYRIDVAKLLEIDWLEVVTGCQNVTLSKTSLGDNFDTSLGDNFDTSLGDNLSVNPVLSNPARVDPSVANATVINQSTDVAAAPPPTAVPPPVGSKPNGDWFREASVCFAGLELTEDNRRLWDEVQAFLANQYDGVSIDDMIRYSRKHFAGTKHSGLVIRSLRALHHALIAGDSENGLYQQTAQHNPKTCAKCLAKAKAKASSNPAAAARQALAYNQPKYRQGYCLVPPFGSQAWQDEEAGKLDTPAYLAWKRKAVAEMREDD
jgi:hypothetical protein